MNSLNTLTALGAALTLLVPPANAQTEPTAPLTPPPAQNEDASPSPGDTEEGPDAMRQMMREMMIEMMQGDSWDDGQRDDNSEWRKGTKGITQTEKAEASYAMANIGAAVPMVGDSE